MANSEMVTAATLKRFLEAFNRHDLDAMMEFFPGQRLLVGLRVTTIASEVRRPNPPLLCSTRATLLYCMS